MWFIITKISKISKEAGAVNVRPIELLFDKQKYGQSQLVHRDFETSGTICCFKTISYILFSEYMFRIALKSMVPDVSKSQ